MLFVMLMLSTALQCLAAGLAFHIIRKSGRDRAWLLIAFALLCMGVRQAITLLQALTATKTLDPVTESVALLTAGLMVAGVWMMGSVFERMNALRIRVREESEKRKNAEGRFRTLFDTATEGILVADLKTQSFKYANPAICNLLGYTHDEMLRLSVSDIHPQHSLPNVLKAFQHHASGERKLSSNQPCLCKDGSIIQVNVNTAVTVIDSRPCLVGFFSDITERIRLQQDYQTLFSKMIDGLAIHEIICDEAGKPVDYRFLAVNPAFERMTGLQATDVVGKTVREVLPETESHWIDAFGRVALTGKPAHFENESAALGKHFEVTAFRNAPQQFTCTFVDVTKRKAMEDELRQIQKLEAIGQLAGGVAHDFNNILTGILNYAEMAHDEIGEDNPVCEWIDQITKEAQRSAHLTRQLLAFARKQTIAPQAVNINDVTARMLKMLRRLIGEDIALSWHPNADAWPVHMDPGQIDQILANLCINARDAISGTGTVTIEIENAVLDDTYCSRHKEARPGEFVVLSVSDDGCGMAQKTIEHIFEPFFTTKDTGMGTGLGLSTVYGIVKQNKGFTNVYSERGLGSTFRVYLPRHNGAVCDPRKARNRTETTGSHETILLVEDEDAVRKTLHMLLQKTGYRVLAAEAPERAIEIAAEHGNQIDLLLTDVVMPDMNGRELSDYLLHRFPHMRCLYMSGYTANVIAHHGILDEGVNFLPKPVTREALARKVRDVLDQPASA